MNNLSEKGVFKKEIIIAILLFFVCFFSVSMTIKGIGLTWDEPYGYFVGVEVILKWGSVLFDSLRKGEIKRAFSREFTDNYWRPPTPETARMDYPNNHPPLSRYGQTVFWLIFHNLFRDEVCYRLFSAFLCSIIVAFLFLLISKHYGVAAGLYASLSLILIPRFFGHAHLAASDIPITAIWFLSVFLFWKALDSKRYILPFSLVFGLALITKFQAFLIPIPLAVYCLIYERKNWKKLLRICLVTAIVAPLVMILTNPTWWHYPVKRIFYNYILLGINHTRHNPIPKYYFGNTYLYTKPWHMPLVMIAITTPLSIIFTFILGIWSIFRNRFHDRLLNLFMINIIFILALFMLPTVNSYDGVRHFLVIYPFCAGVGGVGFIWLCENISKWLSKTEITGRISNLNIKIYILIFIILFSSPVMDVILIHPFELAYYNSLIGGIKGAYKSGMETTYWFDVVNEKFIDFINDNIPLGSRICIFPINPDMFRYLQKKDYIRNDLIFAQKNCEYLILLMRQGLFHPKIWEIFDRCSPIYTTKIDGVPLISIYWVNGHCQT